MTVLTDRFTRAVDHARVAHADLRVAEYVAVHEIANLRQARHTPDFWIRVERAMPDFSQRKAWLAEPGMNVEGI